jgi:hypothetical protein
MLDYPPYRRRLAAEHPDLVVPLEGGRASLDWKRWLRANPTRAFWAEGTLRPRIEKDMPFSYPDGPLIRISDVRASRRTDAAARRFLASSFGRLSRYTCYDYTQELQPLRAALGLVLWHQKLNNSGDLALELMGRYSEL